MLALHQDLNKLLMFVGDEYQFCFDGFAGKKKQNEYEQEQNKNKEHKTRTKNANQILEFIERKCFCRNIVCSWHFIFHIHDVGGGEQKTKEKIKCFCRNFDCSWNFGFYIHWILCINTMGTF